MLLLGKQTFIWQFTGQIKTYGSNNVFPDIF